MDRRLKTDRRDNRYAVHRQCAQGAHGRRAGLEMGYALNVPTPEDAIRKRDVFDMYLGLTWELWLGSARTSCSSVFRHTDRL